jgi:hypothetical protein
MEASGESGLYAHRQGTTKLYMEAALNHMYSLSQPLTAELRQWDRSYAERGEGGLWDEIGATKPDMVQTFVCTSF